MGFKTAITRSPLQKVAPKYIPRSSNHVHAPDQAPRCVLLIIGVCGICGDGCGIQLPKTNHSGNPLSYRIKILRQTFKRNSHSRCAVQNGVHPGAPPTAGGGGVSLACQPGTRSNVLVR